MVLVFDFGSQIHLVDSKGEKEFDYVVDDLDAAQDGEACKETHCTTNQTKS